MKTDIKNISLGDLEKHKIYRRTSTVCYASTTRDLSITGPYPQKDGTTVVRINFYHPIFSKYKYITFYKIDDILFFKLSNTYDDATYTISRKRNIETSLSTQCSSRTAEKLKDFVGNHIMKSYDWQKTYEPIFYILKNTKEDL